MNRIMIKFEITPPFIIQIYSDDLNISRTRINSGILQYDFQGP